MQYMVSLPTGDGWRVPLDSQFVGCPATTIYHLEPNIGVVLTSAQHRGDGHQGAVARRKRGNGVLREHAGLPAGWGCG